MSITVQLARLVIPIRLICLHEVSSWPSADPANSHTNLHYINQALCPDFEHDAV